MYFRVLEPVYIRSEGCSYKVGDKIYLTNERIEEYTEKLENNGERFTDYFEEVGEDYGATETIEDINKRE